MHGSSAGKTVGDEVGNVVETFLSVTLQINNLRRCTPRNREI